MEDKTIYLEEAYGNEKSRLIVIALHVSDVFLYRHNFAAPELDHIIGLRLFDMDSGRTKDITFESGLKNLSMINFFGKFKDYPRMCNGVLYGYVYPICAWDEKREAYIEIYPDGKVREIPNGEKGKTLRRALMTNTLASVREEDEGDFVAEQQFSTKNIGQIKLIANTNRMRYLIITCRVKKDRLNYYMGNCQILDTITGCVINTKELCEILGKPRIGIQKEMEYRGIRREVLQAYDESIYPVKVRDTSASKSVGRHYSARYVILARKSCMQKDEEFDDIEYYVGEKVPNTSVYKHMHTLKLSELMWMRKNSIGLSVESLSIDYWHTTIDTFTSTEMLYTGALHEREIKKSEKQLQMDDKIKKTRLTGVEYDIVINSSNVITKLDTGTMRTAKLPENTVLGIGSLDIEKELDELIVNKGCSFERGLELPKIGKITVLDNRALKTIVRANLHECDFIEVDSSINKNILRQLIDARMRVRIRGELPEDTVSFIIDKYIKMERTTVDGIILYGVYAVNRSKSIADYHKFKERIDRETRIKFGSCGEEPEFAEIGMRFNDTAIMMDSKYIINRYVLGIDKKLDAWIDKYMARIESIRRFIDSITCCEYVELLDMDKENEGIVKVHGLSEGTYDYVMYSSYRTSIPGLHVYKPSRLLEPGESEKYNSILDSTKHKSNIYITSINRRELADAYRNSGAE